MRIGTNPVKEKECRVVPLRKHRVVVPVYIPTREGYFAQSLEVLELCLDSLLATTGNRASISVISNACCDEVVALLQQRFERGQIDRLVLSRQNLGKVGAIMLAFRGAAEALVTWSDCDVLFKSGWLEAIDEVFSVFPECGAVAPFPAPHLAFECTSATVLGAFAGRCLQRQPAVAVADLEEFSRGVGNPTLFRDEYKRSQWVVSRGPVTACIGAGHFICCVRNEVGGAAPKRDCTVPLMGRADMEYLDNPPDVMGLWRLSTARSYVWHMGNVPEPWMRAHVEQLRKSGDSSEATAIPLPGAKRGVVSKLPLQVRRLGARVLRRVLERSVSRTLKKKLARAAQALPRSRSRMGVRSTDTLVDR
jgi:hypothetical protein